MNKYNETYKLFAGKINWSNQEMLFPGVWVYRDVFNQNLNVINRLNDINSQAELENENRLKWTDGFVGYNQKIPSYRDCVDIKLGENPYPQNQAQRQAADLWKDLYAAQGPAVVDYCTRYSLQMDYWEVMNCIKYGKGQHFQEHADHGFSYSATVSLVGYPNDDYIGGNLSFPKLNLDIKPKAGDLYIFPSTYLFSHIARPVEDGIKYSIVTMLDYNDHAHNQEFMQMRERWVANAQG